eukprot:CAMPEP_0205818738 /NCGR_PEP_ID=MMETSP0206-20130828/770_1 /ASSEMBLY_ACC=CAM_ASM_000279 /TAXON_ID=36767 /ORGANISM="Euplotes focardii, Strain TN1" /LENGTH=70 /DNA_ID=CAMNT_0053111429 /DNA_START=232 /DNA_END=441 /DNA_ORIENTATION=+
MSVGSASKLASAKTESSMHRTDASKKPVEYVNAERAQLNQVEQFPFFLAALASCSLMVSGPLAGALGAFW